MEVAHATRLDYYRLECEDSHLSFTRYFFKHRQGQRFRVNWHHHLIADELERVITGETQNLLINVPPGSSKTEMAVINFIARGLAINPWSRFLHLSYSDDLALTNSQAARDLVASEEYQALWSREIAVDANAKGRWNVLLDGKRAGGVYATSTGGQITGFRAGHMADGFQGAIIVDDPLKPEDAFSKPKLESANRRLLTTIKSRRANPQTPIIVIMQRIAENDPSGFILNGGMGLTFRHVVIPAIIDERYVDKLPPKYNELVETDAPEGERFSYWPYKEPIQELLSMEKGAGTDQSGQRMGRHVFAGQYMQSPVAIGGNILRGEWLKRYKLLPKLKYRVMYGDTAQKTKEHNDYSVFQVWGMGADGWIYLTDQIRGKWEAPELRARVKAFWAKHYALSTADHGALRELAVEDKVSGTGLIQDLRAEAGIPVRGIERNRDKLTRIMDVLPYMEQGMVWIPESAPFTSDLIAEAEAFTADDTHANDDQLDPMVDAATEFLSTRRAIAVWERLAR